MQSVQYSYYSLKSLFPFNTYTVGVLDDVANICVVFLFCFVFFRYFVFVMPCSFMLLYICLCGGENICINQVMLITYVKSRNHNSDNV